MCTLSKPIYTPLNSQIFGAAAMPAVARRKTKKTTKGVKKLKFIKKRPGWSEQVPRLRPRCAVVQPPPLIFPKGQALRVATDFSGLEAPVLTLIHRLRVSVDQVFGSDILRAAQVFSESHLKPRRFYSDARMRNDIVADPCDLYVAGFPCQSFSSLGKRAGFGGGDARGNLVLVCLSYVAHQHPPMVVLECVTHFGKAARHAKALKLVINTLEELGYQVCHRILDSRDFALPVSRPRWYLVAILRSHARTPFAWPEPSPLSVGFSDIVKPLPRHAWRAHPPKSSKLRYANAQRHLKRLVGKGVRVFETPVIIDCDSSRRFSNATVGLAPCLTRTRCASGGYWCTTKGGFLDAGDLRLLMGLDYDMLDAHCMTDTDFRGMIGNSMSINVLCHLLPAVLHAAGYISEGDRSRMMVLSGYSRTS